MLDGRYGRVTLRVTLPSQNDHPARQVTPAFLPSQLFSSHANSSPRFVRKCIKSWIAQDSSGRRVTFLPGQTFFDHNASCMFVTVLQNSHKKTSVYNRLFSRFPLHALFVPSKSLQHDCVTCFSPFLSMISSVSHSVINSSKCP